MIHLAFVLVTMLILPVSCIVLQAGSGADLVHLVGRWFVFWAAGARLLVAGLRQVIAPRLTVEGIFGVAEPRVWPLAQELGFWNLAMGLLCLATLAEQAWLLPLALASALFYALAGAKHAIGGAHSLEARTAMISDLAIAVVLLGYGVLAFHK